MPRRDRAPRAPFDSLGPLDTAIPISTGTARLTVETDGSVLLDVNGVPSSHLHPDPEHLVFEYMRWMLQVIDLHLEESDEERAAQLAHLGGGGCSLPRAVASRHPRARQIVVELDALLAERVREWFDLPRSPRLRLRVDDARTALADWREDRFDVLVRDVFAGSVTPPELIGLAAVRDAARVLRPGGLYLANCAAPPGTRLLADEVATLSAVFSHVGVIAEPAHLTGKRRGNCVLLASQRPLPDGIDRALRSDAVSVRLARQDRVLALARAGTVLGGD
ncbi:spermidine synthase [Brachybacterium paraconglomeratum]|uniref:spermidine synthase n=1 Tax=Brachybacterium paraconglomeratum TaxID=173362 RepID=UPI0021A4DAA2|nr:fused MFS/spermidine synthase [Brachybacterium paraconglomeratum]MCT1908941.1 fused MFS/spermidine synthase [Brachybacterium paraconglomeratum]MDV3295064.1 fused MFS/spermidine synthase [Brachybacterium paraconglomeratum]